MNIKVLLSVFLIAVSSAYAQLIPSGSQVTIVGSLPAGSNTIGKVDQGTAGASAWLENLSQVGGVAISTGNGVTGTGSIRVTVASDNTAFTVNAAQSGAPWSQNITQINGTSLLAGNGVTGTGSPRVTIASDNTPIPISNLDNGACGNTNYSTAWAAIPTSSTAATSTTTCLKAMLFTNTNASAQSITVIDGQGSPITLVATYSIPGNSTVVFPMYGTVATTGIKWQAGGTGITGSAVGKQ